ncbi:MAG: hypothetical protein RLO17_14635 [Cyclobacteriaceae bacterium]
MNQEKQLDGPFFITVNAVFNAITLASGTTHSLVNNFNNVYGFGSGIVVTKASLKLIGRRTNPADSVRYMIDQHNSMIQNGKYASDQWDMLASGTIDANNAVVQPFGRDTHYHRGLRLDVRDDRTILRTSIIDDQVIADTGFNYGDIISIDSFMYLEFLATKK